MAFNLPVIITEKIKQAELLIPDLKGKLLDIRAEEGDFVKALNKIGNFESSLSHRIKKSQNQEPMKNILGINEIS
jgi:hypothetical protein